MSACVIACFLLVLFMCSFYDGLLQLDRMVTQFGEVHILGWSQYKLVSVS